MVNQLSCGRSLSYKLCLAAHLHFSRPKLAGMGKIASVCRPYPFSLVNFERSLVPFAALIEQPVHRGKCLLPYIAVESLLKEERRKERKNKKNKKEKKKEKKKNDLFTYTEVTGEIVRYLVVKSHWATF